nr:THAP domain-containing protein 2-like [Hydra vulgaris]
MVNKCAASKCTSVYLRNKHKQIASFHFPTNQNLYQLWVRFVNRSDWTPTKHSVLCELHFEDKYIIKVKNEHNLNEAVAPPRFHFKRFEKGVVFYNIIFNEQTYFPTILESITVDVDLNVFLKYKETPLPLPSWFVKEHNAKPNKISMLENFPSY